MNTGTWFKRSTLHDGDKQRPASSGSQKHKKRHKEGLKVDTSHLQRERAEEREEAHEGCPSPWLESHGREVRRSEVSGTGRAVGSRGASERSLGLH